ncbi:MAG: lysophospholipid acyltransferase family protein [Nitrospiraceae bacterium]|nr:lysophospholipid acyltransferase family protein [Nitrospiraceae bacterium]
MTATEIRSLLRPRSWPTLAGILLMRLISLLPFRLIWLFGLGAGFLISLFPSRLKRIARKNIDLCFPQLSESDRRRLVNRHFGQLGVMVMSYGIAWWSSKKRLSRLVRLRDRHHYDDAVRSGKRIILFAPHFLALDLSGLRLSTERPMITMYRESRDKVLDRMLRKRARFGGVLFERKSNLRSLIRLIREGRPFYYLPDQDPGGAESVFVPFFGVPTATVTAFARIAELTDAVVIPCYNRILPAGQGFEVRFEAPFEHFPSGDPAGDARRMNEAIEGVVREQPEQYLWVYRRFKTRPLGSPSVY